MSYTWNYVDASTELCFVIRTTMDNYQFCYRRFFSSSDIRREVSEEADLRDFVVYPASIANIPTINLIVSRATEKQLVPKTTLCI